MIKITKGLDKIFNQPESSESGDSIVDDSSLNDQVDLSQKSANENHRCTTQKIPQKNVFVDKYDIVPIKKPIKKVKSKRHSRYEMLQSILYKRRDSTTDTKLKKLYELKNEGNLYYSRKRNSYIFKAETNISYLSPTHLRQNPFTKFRFMDYIFQLNSLLFDQNIDLYTSQ